MTYTPKFPRHSRRPLGAPAEVDQSGFGPFAPEDLDDAGMVPIAVAVREAVLEIMLAYLERTPASEMGSA